MKHAKTNPGDAATSPGFFFVLTGPCAVRQATCKRSSQLRLLRRTVKKYGGNSLKHLLSAVRLEKGSSDSLSYISFFFNIKTRPCCSRSGLIISCFVLIWRARLDSGPHVLSAQVCYAGVFNPPSCSFSASRGRR